MERITLEELKPILYDKWLDYYEANHQTIGKVMKYGHQSNAGDNKRPSSDFIIGTMLVLEPRLEEFLSYFFLVCSDLDKIVSVLGLGIIPSIALENRRKQNCGHKENEHCCQ